VACRRRVCAGWGSCSALLAALTSVAHAAQQATQPSAMQSACASNPWIDVRCYGAAGNDRNDDSAALADALRAALAGDQPLLLPHGAYKLTRRLVIDYAERANTGFRLMSMGAILDGRNIAGGPVLEVICSGGTSVAPKGCFYFREEGTLFVYADTTLMPPSSADATSPTRRMRSRSTI
jgi:hypothetical protein